MINITGDWYNELNSKMVLHVNGKSITGSYQTKVGNAFGIYDLVGSVDTDNDDSTAIGWVVLWNNQYGSSDSVTAWSGQIRDIGGVETIVTTWLLTSESDPGDFWHSTLINKDTFTRIAPTPEDVEKNLNKGLKESFPQTLR